MTAAQFGRILVHWYESNPRDLAWKGTRDPYLIWISEIILQQTRVDQGTPYYEKFISKFPTISDLAKASEAEVLKIWEGLGYYSRARNLHATARYIVEQYNGILPGSYDQLLKLKGIGPYTAAAISSFAFDQPHPAIDGNVSRFIARLDGVTDPLESSTFRKKISDFLNLAILYEKPSDFNQALINFGAMVCKPGKPLCESCPFQENCQAFQSSMQTNIPFKSKRIARKMRFFHFFHFEVKGHLFIEKRSGKDIWHNLYTLPWVETNTDSRFSSFPDMLFDNKYAEFVKPSTYSIAPTVTLKQILTHQLVTGHFYKISCHEVQNQINQPFHLVDSKNLSNFAFPKIIRTYFAESGILPD